MNETSATSQSGASLLPDGIGALTTVHLVIVALLAIAAVAIIVVGARRKRVRNQAEQEVARNAEQAGVARATEDEPATPPPAPLPPPPPPTPAPAAPTPVPAPPPIDAPADPVPLADEPVAAAAPMDASPASEALPEPSPEPANRAAITGGDAPVTQLKGLGPKVSAKLAELGVTTVGQLAALDDASAAALDAELGPFRGRMARDRWIEQARLLAAGDRAGFEAVFGKL